MPLFRKWCISPVYLLSLIVLSLVLYLFAYLPRRLSGRYYHYLARVWCRMLVRVLDVDLHCISHAQQALPAHYILVANHPSALEDFAIPALFDIYPLAKIEVRDWWILGRISDYAGTIYVHRENVTSRKQALATMVDAVNQGKNLVIFPEGGCKGKDIYQEFKPGAFDIAISAGVPILPVYLHYLDEDTFEWHEQTLPAMLWQIFKNRNNRVEYHVYDALYPQKDADKYQLAEQTRQMFLKWQKEHRTRLRAESR